MGSLPWAVARERPAGVGTAWARPTGSLDRVVKPFSAQSAGRGARKICLPRPSPTLRVPRPMPVGRRGGRPIDRILATRRHVPMCRRSTHAPVRGLASVRMHARHRAHRTTQRARRTQQGWTLHGEGEGRSTRAVAVIGRPGGSGFRLRFSGVLIAGVGVLSRVSCCQPLVALSRVGWKHSRLSMPAYGL